MVMMPLLAMVILNRATHFIIAICLLLLLMVLMVFVSCKPQDASTHHPRRNLLLQLVFPVLFLFLCKIGAVRQVLDLQIYLNKSCMVIHTCVCVMRREMPPMLLPACQVIWCCFMFILV